MPVLILFFVVLRWAFGIACALALGVLMISTGFARHPEGLLIPIMAFWTFWCALEFLRSIGRVLRGI
jgi:hypothetical protein